MFFGKKKINWAVLVHKERGKYKVEKQLASSSLTRATDTTLVCTLRKKQYACRMPGNNKRVISKY